jgi:hypothetical protein
MARRRGRSLLVLASCAVTLLLGTHAARAQQCTVSDGETIVQGLLDDVIAPFNAAWPSICEATGLDPFDNVFDGSVNLGCGLGDLGDTVCGLQASSCKSMWADVDVSQITGLENLSLTSLTVTSTDATSGTTCPYSSKAVDDTSFSCSFSGEGTGDAALSGGDLSADLSSIEIRVECDALGGLDDFKETIWEGHATATAKSGTATADVKYCAGICSVDSGLASLVYLGMSNLKLKLDGVSVDIVTDGSSYDIDEQIEDEIADQIADALKVDIENAIAPVISEALNDEVKEILPLPSSCSSSSSSSAPAVAAAADTAQAVPGGALLCYDAGLAPGSSPFTSLLGLRLTDERRSSKEAVVREAQVCTPVATSGGATALESHFVGYVLLPEFGAPTSELPDATLVNELGEHHVTFGGALPDMLFSAAAPEDEALDVGCVLAPGAYRCSAASAVDASSPDAVVSVSGASGDTLVRVQSVRSVCGPLEVDGQRPERGRGWFACYGAVPADGGGFAPEPPVEVASELGSQTLTTLGVDRRLCVPTLVEFSVPAPTPAAQRRVTPGSGRSSGGLGFVGTGASCPRIRSHLDPGLGIYERTPILGVVR